MSRVAAIQYQESATIEPGSGLTVIQTPVGRLGLAVCFDIRFPEMFAELAREGAELFAIPSAFTAMTVDLDYLKKVRTSIPLKR